MAGLKWAVSVDLDGVLCEPGPIEQYGRARPIDKNIEKVNKLFALGFRIIIHTARSWGSYDITRTWLRNQKVEYTDLVMGKVLAEFYIDDHNSTLDAVLEDPRCK